MLVPHAVGKRIETEKEADRECGTCPQARPGGQISHVVNLNPFTDSHELQAAPDRRMLDSSVVCHVLNLRIRDSAVVIEKGREPPAGDVTVFVDGRRQNSSSVFLIPNRIIGASTEKRNAQWGASNNHLLHLPL